MNFKDYFDEVAKLVKQSLPQTEEWQGRQNLESLHMWIHFLRDCMSEDAEFLFNPMRANLVELLGVTPDSTNKMQFTITGLCEAHSNKAQCTVVQQRDGVERELARFTVELFPQG